jgi:hypothetical protein
MGEGIVDWPSVVNTFIATLPAILIALGTLIVSLRTKAEVKQVNGKVNGIHDEQTKVREKLEDTQFDDVMEIKVKNGKRKE